MKVAQKFSGGGVPKSPNPLEGPPTPDPLGSHPFIYQSIALNLRILNIYFLMGLTLEVQKLCSLGPPAAVAKYPSNHLLFAFTLKRQVRKTVTVVLGSIA